MYTHDDARRHSCTIKYFRTEMKQRMLFMLDQVAKPHESVLTAAADLRTTSAVPPMLRLLRDQVVHERGEEGYC